MRRIVLTAGAWSFGLLICFPFFWMLSTAVKPAAEIFATPPTVIPRTITLEHFVALWERTQFFTYFMNSLLVAGGTVLLTISVATLGAYSLARCRYPGRDQLSVFILFSYMLAPIVVIVPFYTVMRTLGLVNTHLGLVLTHTSFCFPFALWLLRSYFRAIPVEIEEAAWMDGAGRLRAIVSVVAPLAVPGIIATTIFTFILSWNDYVFALILTTSAELKTLPVGMQDLYQATLVEWGVFMSAGVVITLPVLVGFSFIQRYLIAGWGSGALKG